MNFKDTLNGKNLQTEFGLIIQTGTAAFLEFPERKDALSNDWPDEDGVEYDLASVHLKDREPTLKCAFLAPDDTAFWKNYNAFFAELTKPGLHQLYLYDHGAAYKCFYRKTGDFVKTLKRLKNVPVVFVKFDLTLKIVP